MRRSPCCPVVLICLGLASALMSCSPKAECEVVYDPGSRLCLVRLNPPGERGESKQQGTMERSVSISRKAGGPLLQVASYTVDVTRVFGESGNTYAILGTVSLEIENDKAVVTAYDLTVTGGRYRKEQRHFTKP
jgi:hypothetical protein